MYIDITIQATINTGIRKVQLLVEEKTLNIYDGVYEKAKFSEITEQLSREIKRSLMNYYKESLNES